MFPNQFKTLKEAKDFLLRLGESGKRPAQNIRGGQMNGAVVMKLKGDKQNRTIGFVGNVPSDEQIEQFKASVQVAESMINAAPSQNKKSAKDDS